MRLLLLEAAPPALAPPGSDGISLIVPMGVALGCVTMGAVALMLWLASRRMDREAAAAAGLAADEERARRCSLESDRGAPHLPRLPVIIVLPDNKSLSFGWQLQHTPRASPTASCAKGASSPPAPFAAEQSKQEASIGSSPRTDAAPAPPATPPGAGAAAPLPAAGSVLSGRQGNAAWPIAQPAADGPRRRPPLVSIVVLDPEHVQVVQPHTPSAEPSFEVDGPTELDLQAAQTPGGAVRGCR